MSAAIVQVPPGRIQTWQVLTSKQGLGLPDCHLQLLWGPFHPEGKWAREMKTLLSAPTPYLAQGFLPLRCKSYR